MLKISNNTPTSTLLSIKVNDDLIDENGISGKVVTIDILDNDEFWLFIFKLNNKQQIEIKKIKNIC